jgi:hypothetical protein
MSKGHGSDTHHLGEVTPWDTPRETGSVRLNQKKEGAVAARVACHSQPALTTTRPRPHRPHAAPPLILNGQRAPPLHSLEKYNGPGCFARPHGLAGSLPACRSHIRRQNARTERTERTPRALLLGHVGVTPGRMSGSWGPWGAPRPPGAARCGRILFSVEPFWYAPARAHRGSTFGFPPAPRDQVSRHATLQPNSNPDAGPDAT